MSKVEGEAHKIANDGFIPSVKIVEYGKIYYKSKSINTDFQYPGSIGIGFSIGETVLSGYRVKDIGNGIIQYEYYYNDGSYIIIQVNNNGVFKD